MVCFAILGTTEPDFYGGSATGIPRKNETKTKTSEVRMVVVMKLVETCLAREADPAKGMSYHALSQQNI